MRDDEGGNKITEEGIGEILKLCVVEISGEGDMGVVRGYPPALC